MINGGINYTERGIVHNIKAMRMQTALMSITNENVVGFDKVGYQRKIPVVSSFAEFLGEEALSTTIDDTVGRLVLTQNPLDIALADKGYFQIKTNEGIKLSRDGRLKMTKDGEILSLDGSQILDNMGNPVILPIVPEKPEDISIDLNGTIKVYNPKTKKLETATTLSVVTAEGIAVLNPNVRQCYSEHSNVSLHTEFLQAVPYTKTFNANNQMYKIQNSVLQKAISSLSS